MCGGNGELEKHLQLPCSGLLLPPKKGESYDLMAVLSAAALPQGVRCSVLLLWEGELPSVAAEQVIGCGFSPRSTLTLSSLGPPRAVLSVQRVLRCTDGRCVLPQDIPLPPQWCDLLPETQLMLAGMALLLGTMEV